MYLARRSGVELMATPRSEMSDEPKTLEYFPERPRIESSAIAWYAFLIPGGVIVAVGLFAPDWALPAGVTAALVMWYRRRRLLKRPHATLRVKDGHLIVTDARSQAIFSKGLDELYNVTLETKTIQKVQENMSSGIPDLRFIDSRVGPSIDNCRIELVTSDEVVTLTDFFTSSIDANDWFSKIRRFLKQNGWRPLDEREPPAGAA